jgi:hypothetical protein
VGVCGKNLTVSYFFDRFAEADMIDKLACLNGQHISSMVPRSLTKIKEIMMPSLQEYYDRTVELLGEDSAGAKNTKRQLDNEAYSKSRKADRTFLSGSGPSFQSLNKAG